MKKLTLYLNFGKNTILLQEPLQTNVNSILTVKKATIFWQHENILKDVNDRITYNSDTLVLDPGYWTFDTLKPKLIGVNGKNKDITIEKSVHDSKCYISVPSGDTINLKKFGLLLGFPENQSITATTKSPSIVDMHSGLRFITLSCNVVNSSYNYDQDGHRSQLISTFPITSTQHLHGTVTSYELSIHSSLKNGTFRELQFHVGTNIVGLQTQLKLLVDIEIK